MICPTCGTMCGDEVKFCTICGTPINSVDDIQPHENPNNDNSQDTLYQNQQQYYNDGYQQTATPVNNSNFQDTSYQNQQQSYNYGYQQPNAPVNNGNFRNTSYQTQQQPYNYGYQQPTPPVNNIYVQQPTRSTEHVSVGGWIGVFFLGILPIVNIVMLFVWAFGGTSKQSLKNYARAALILWLIAVVLIIITIAIIFALGANIWGGFRSLYYYY